MIFAIRLSVINSACIDKYLQEPRELKVMNKSLMKARQILMD